MTNHYDAIVIGLGGMGSATLYHLAKRGLKALGIEQFEVPHNLGSSHGISRIIRLAYYEDLSYVPLLRRSYALWDELEREFGEQLFFRTGSIDMGPEDSEVFSGSLRSCLENDFEHEVLNSAELRTRFPRLSHAGGDDGGFSAEWRPAGAGALHQRACRTRSRPRRCGPNGRTRAGLGFAAG